MGEGTRDNEQAPSWKTLAKEKGQAWYGCAREKASVYWRIARDKTVETWQGGAKGKAICIGAVVGALILGRLVFCGKSSAENGTAATAIPFDETEQAASEEWNIAQEQPRGNAAGAEAPSGVVVTLENAASEAMFPTEIWGRIFKYEPEKRVSYAEFAEVYYTIEDAFLPVFMEPLNKLQSGQPFSPKEYAKLFMQKLIPRIDHLLYHCCRTGLRADASEQERQNYVRLLVMAKLGKDMILSYASAFEQNSRNSLESANENLNAFLALRKALPKHEAHGNPETREKRYAALPQPVRPIDLDAAARNIVGECRTFFRHFYESWPIPEGDSERAREFQEKEQEKASRRLAAAQIKRVPIDVGSFPIKTFCGLEFGQTFAACEKALGDPIGPLYYIYDNYPYSYHYAAYQLKKPFRKFTRAFLYFGTEKMEYLETPEKRFIEGLRAIRLEADIPADVNYESCLEELAKVKKMLEEKYKLNMGKGESEGEYYGRNFWYGAELPKYGQIVLGIFENKEGEYGMKDASMTMVLDITYASAYIMEMLANSTREKLEAKRAAEAESKKKKLNISDNEGADVL